jgi:N-sulfoglucosamine sulfohydrolase
VFTTDHGAALPRAKCTLYDPGIAVALIWRWPAAGVGGGRVISEMISNVDVAPSLFAGLGLPAPAAAQGHSFWSLLVGNPYVPRTEVFAEKTFHTYYEPMRAVRTATHKLIWNFEVSTVVDVPVDIRASPIYPLMLEQFAAVRPLMELYDLTVDPWEQHNRADAPELAAVQDDLRQRLWHWMTATADPLLAGPIASPYAHAALRRLQGS